MNFMSREQALRDFFAYTYLKVSRYTRKNIFDYNEECIAKAIERAYKDATMMGAYNSLISKDNSNLKNKSNEAKEKAVQLLQGKFGISEKIVSIAINDFDTWHREVCESLVETYQEIKDENNKNFFTYGNAQKWLNMTLKYLWLLNRLPNDMDEKALHAPIDSYILQKLKKLEIEGVTGSGETFYYKKKCWSNIDKYNEYMELQEKIRKFAKADGKSVIEWENEAWIEMSVARKNAEREKRKE